MAVTVLGELDVVIVRMVAVLAIDGVRVGFDAATDCGDCCEASTTRSG